MTLMYSIIMNNRDKNLCLFKQSMTLMLMSYGASGALTDQLVDYGVTVGSSMKRSTMDNLGEVYNMTKIGEHLKAGGCIATICKLVDLLA